jgi:GNAT superfamily N-acetyltransferase
VQQWGAERIEELTALVAVSAPDEDLTADELLTALYDQPGVVFGHDDGSGVVAVGVGRDPSGTLVASLRIVAVHPERRGAGVGAALLGAAEAWAVERGAARIELGGLLPFPLWPGVDPESGLVGLARSSPPST